MFMYSFLEQMNTHCEPMMFLNGDTIGSLRKIMQDCPVNRKIVIIFNISTKQFSIPKQPNPTPHFHFQTSQEKNPGYDPLPERYQEK